MFNIFGNSTAPTVSWEPEPLKRGTWSVLSSCLITTSLCVWTAVHLNIPEKEDKPRGLRGKIRKFFSASRFWRKIAWLLMGVLTPEMVAFTAWSQRREASFILDSIRIAFGQKKSPKWYEKLLPVRRAMPALGPEDPEPSDSSNRHPWTMVHAFYVVMGGFIFDVTGHDKPFLPRQSRRMTLYWKIFLELAQKEPKLIPNISESYILDKSKAGGVAKLLVCIQAGWFCAQCISRLAQDIPISLLELNTFGHSVCALIIYFLWWEKPFEVEEADVIEGDQIPPIFAWLWTRNYSALGFGRREWVYFGEIPKIKPLAQEELEDRTDVDHPTTISNGDSSNPKPELHISHKISKSSGDSTELYGAKNKTTKRRDLEGGSVMEFHSGDVLIPATVNSIGIRSESHRVLRLTPVDIERWELVSQFLSRGPDLRAKFISLRARSGNIPAFDIVDTSDPIWVVVIFAGAIYGGLHALAWNAAQFPTPTEKLLWRISASVVMSSGLVLFLFVVFFSMGGDYFNSDRSLAGYVLVVVAILVFVFYVLARAYLVVESFLSLFHCPAGIYDLPQWSSYFPHVT